MTSIAFLVVVGSVFIDAFVARQIWSWYAPMLVDIETPRMLFFFGLATFVMLFRMFTYNPDKKPDETEVLVRVGIAIARPMCALFFAWLGYAIFA